MNVSELLNVYFYALYDEGDHQAHSGLATSLCAEAVRADIFGNYAKPRYITIHRIPNLIGVYDNEMDATIVMERKNAPKIGMVISCDSCAKCDTCKAKPHFLPKFCEKWRAKE